MKKLIFALVMIAILTSTVHAQDYLLDGYFNTGLGFFTNADENDNYLKQAGVDSEQDGFRFQLNGDFWNIEKNAGFKFRFQMQGYLETIDNYFSFPYAYGWLGFMENKINFSAGFIEDNTWQTKDWWLASDLLDDFAGLGVLVKYSPMENLIFGAGAYTHSRNYENVNKLDLEDARLTFHASYIMEDIFYFGGSYRTKSSLRSGDNIAAQNTSMFFLEFRLLAVENLTAVIAAKIDNLEDFLTTGDKTEPIEIYSETFSYKIDNFILGFNFAQFVFNRKFDSETGFIFNPWGSYTIDNKVLRIDFVYAINGISSTDNWHRRNFTIVRRADNSVFSVRPSFWINLDNKTHVEIGDMVNVNMIKSSSVFTNVFYIDFKWIF